MTETPFLSVCIPTYNRPQKLRRLLETLLSQLTAECELIILDNCSNEVMETSVSDLLRNFNACPVRFIRNPVNIGLSANILRCFEVARGEWIWVTGDDDLPEKNAIACMLEESHANPDTVFINFGSTVLQVMNTIRRQTIQMEGLAGFIKAVDNFSNLLFISAGIYRRKSMIGHVRHAYAFLETHAPHIALLLIALSENGGISQLSHRQTIDWGIPDSGAKWNTLVVYKKLQRLLDLIPSQKLRTIWFRKVSLFCPPPQRTCLSLGKFLVSKKGDLGSIRDQLELASYLACMLPSYRWRAFRIWLTARLISWLWRPFYFVWSLFPSKHPESLSNYGLEDDLMKQFLDDSRL